MSRLTLFIVSGMFLLMLGIKAQAPSVETNVLLGTWKLDMSPEDRTDANFAMMKITKVESNTFEGEFYRDGVMLQEGRLNTQTGILYGALVSGDGTGQYNTSFYYKDGKLIGTTHAVGRNFLAVWEATKED